MMQRRGTGGLRAAASVQYADSMSTIHVAEAGIPPLDELSAHREEILRLPGALADGVIVVDAIERFWADLLPWVERHGITLVETQRVPF
jgi:hypothetical protein